MEYTLTLSRAKAVLRQHDLLLDTPRCPGELTFPAIAYDSRTVAPGGLFVCKGLNTCKRRWWPGRPAMWRSSPTMTPPPRCSSGM